MGFYGNITYNTYGIQQGQIKPEHLDRSYWRVKTQFGISSEKEFRKFLGIADGEKDYSVEKIEQVFNDMKKTMYYFSFSNENIQKLFGFENLIGYVFEDQNCKELRCLNLGDRAGQVFKYPLLVLKEEGKIKAWESVLSNIDEETPDWLNFDTNCNYSDAINFLLQNSITTSQLKDNVITTDKINSQAVTTDKINSQAVTTDKIYTQTITPDKLDRDYLEKTYIPSIEGYNTLFGTIKTLKDAGELVPPIESLQGTIYVIGELKLNLPEGYSNPQDVDNYVGIPYGIICNFGKCLSWRDNNTIYIISYEKGWTFSVEITTEAIDENDKKWYYFSDEGQYFKFNFKQIFSPMIGPKAITRNKINLEAIGTEQIAQEAITEGKIGNAAVTEDKISDGAVTADKISDGAVTANKISEGAVTYKQIAPKTIDPNHMIYDCPINQSGVFESDSIMLNYLINWKDRALNQKWDNGHTAKTDLYFIDCDGNDNFNAIIGAGRCLGYFTAIRVNLAQFYILNLFTNRAFLITYDDTEIKSVNEITIPSQFINSSHLDFPLYQDKTLPIYSNYSGILSWLGSPMGGGSFKNIPINHLVGSAQPLERDSYFGREPLSTIIASIETNLPFYLGNLSNINEFKAAVQTYSLDEYMNWSDQVTRAVYFYIVKDSDLAERTGGGGSCMGTLDRLETADGTVYFTNMSTNQHFKFIAAGPGTLTEII